MAPKPVAIDLEPFDPIAPLALGVVRSLWRLYLNPHRNNAVYRQEMADEIVLSSQEALKRLNLLRQKFTEIATEALERSGKKELAKEIQGSEVKWRLLDRVETMMRMSEIDARAMAQSIPDDVISYYKEYCRVHATSFGDFIALFERDSITADELISNNSHPELARHFFEHFQHALAQFRIKTSSLSPRLVTTVRQISSEYLEWISLHPNVLDKIAWEAFEKVIAEVFASYGFVVDITARVRNQSADLIAVRIDEFGVEHRYLVECKRYSRSRRIGLDIVNAVLGAARRADVDHAFLVTTGYYSNDVLSLKQTFQDLRLHLRDGDEVLQWLSAYKAKHGGLWIAPNLNLY